MKTRALTATEVSLFEQARSLLQRAHHPELHQVAAAVQTASGSVYLGLHMGSRRINICAESSALANAQMAADTQIVSMVAVCKNENDRIVVTNPCGFCRELMGTYCQDANVIVDVQGIPQVVTSGDLMPLPWMFPHENQWSVREPSSQTAQDPEPPESGPPHPNQSRTEQPHNDQHDNDQQVINQHVIHQHSDKEN